MSLRAIQTARGTVTGMLVGVLVFFAGLLFSIVAHEFGHYLVARRVGARISEFMVGFGPTLMSFKRGPTHFGLKALPLGGYVRILGMTPPSPHSPSETPTEQAVPGKDFYRLSSPRRTAVLLAGPFANLVLAAFLLVVVISGLGLPRASTTIGSVSECVSVSSCIPSDAPSPAASAGLLPGDRIVGVDSQPVDTWDETVSMIASRRPGSSATFSVVSASGTAREVDVVLAANPTNADLGFLGVTPSIEAHRYSPDRVPQLMWSNTVAVTRTLATFPLRVFSAFDDSLSGRERNMEDPVGLVGAGRIGADIGSADVPASYRLGQLLTLIAGLNISLAVFNLIPLLPLDGGHVALAFLDAARNATARLRRRPTPQPFDANRLLPLTRLVVTFLIVSSVILLFVDIANPVGVGR